LALIVERFLRILTNKFVFVSRTEQQIAMKYGLTSISKCVLIENGIQINSQVRVEHGKSRISSLFREKIPNGSFIIGMLSRFDHVKNISYAIKTLSDYLKRHSEVFLIIGGDGEGRMEIERTISKYNLQNKVKLLGFIKEIKCFFLLIDVYLNTSLGEAFGLSTVEAMKYCKPVVASKVCGNIDVVDDNNTGLLFSLNKPSMLVEKIKTLKDNRRMYDYLAKNASESVIKRFDLNRMINETRELYLSFTPVLRKRINLRIGINSSKVCDVHTGVGRYTSNLRKSILKANGRNNYYFYVPGNTGNAIISDGSGAQSDKPETSIQNNTLRILWEQLILPIYSRKDRLDLFHYKTFIKYIRFHFHG